jgi:hypothetical protein
MRKTIVILVMALMVMCSGNVFAGSPPVDLNRVVVSGVNIAITPEDKSYVIPSSMFGLLFEGQEYSIIINAEADQSHACYIALITPENGESPMIGDFFYEPGIHFIPPYTGIYAVRCTVAPDTVDLIGIAVEIED